ncbi:hypothetical protein CIHG_09039 [Coccidioides immitis H538.4]|uniref:Uncharacterized protein n=3 Tax=Coccidioides immitis TaxID=5501 RepID=A0A0J8R0T8_COCIT|nr:hypothetical protein CIRG_05865 [Coccidioides immitis RMSCC 2394]KMU78346.1 hypothetical protein CISG_06582 [Coccidioides immitis RMSCC 3703]KMU91227.1 hypothetical protein CIHG_09039 [Coccidioides immitis H538.4]
MALNSESSSKGKGTLVECRSSTQAASSTDSGGKGTAVESRSLTETASSTNHKGKGKSKTPNSTSSSHGPKQPSKVRKPQRKTTTTKSRDIQRRIGFVGPNDMIVVQPHRSIH